ncbi:MAG: hypothetical protein U1F68_06640 [Gammaproteobacteria bacterium]
MDKKTLQSQGLAGESAHTRIVALTLVTIVLLLLPLLGLSYYALVAFERRLLPEIERKALRVGLSIDNRYPARAGFRHPFAKLEGMNEFFAAKLEAARDIAYVAAADRTGRILSPARFVQRRSWHKPC